MKKILHNGDRYMLELKDFEAAADRLKNVIHNIPLSTSATFSAMTGAEVYLKYENQQKTGSFKVRGAYNKIMKRYAEGDLHAVVASSAGNHAQGVAFAASSVGVKSTIVMLRRSPRSPRPRATALMSFWRATFMTKPMPRPARSARRPARSSSIRSTMRTSWPVRAPSRSRSCATCRLST